MPSLSFREVLHGGFYLLSDPVDERTADLQLAVEVRSLGAFLQSLTANLAGEVGFEGFADDAYAEGKLWLTPEQRRATYEVSFPGNDGSPYRFRGHKELELLNPADALTLLQGSVYDANAREIGRAVVRFDARGGLGSLMRSIRLRL